MLGIILSNGKGSFLIAGFNTLPQEEKKNMIRLHSVSLWGK